MFLKYFTKKSLRCSRPLHFPAENKADADSRNFSFYNNCQKQLCLTLLTRVVTTVRTSRKSKLLKRCKTKSNRLQRTIFFDESNNNKPVNPCCEERDGSHFKATSLPKSRENRLTDVLPFSSGSSKVDRSEHDLYSGISCRLLSYFEKIAHMSVV